MRRLLAVLAAGAAVLLVPASPVFAHASLERSEPAANSVLEESPTAVVLDFDEDVEPALSSIRVYDSAGAEVAVGDTVAGDDASILRADVPTLVDGLYAVVWQASSSDGHVVDGAFSFQVGTAATGDGDSLSIGLGQLSHAIRRNVNLLYLLENNGVYGLTKGQFSAAADKGSVSKKGEGNTMDPIDSAALALTLGATFVARSFSGDKEQLVPLIKAGLAHNGFAFIDIISPCVTFNDHEGSTKSYAYTREKKVDIVYADFVPPATAITADYASGDVRADGSAPG